MQERMDAIEEAAFFRSHRKAHIFAIFGTEQQSQSSGKKIKKSSHKTEGKG